MFNSTFLKEFSQNKKKSFQKDQKDESKKRKEKLVRENNFGRFPVFITIKEEIIYVYFQMYSCYNHN